MRRSIVLSCVLAVLATAVPALAAPASPEALLQGVEIPHRKFTLDNGLTLVVHEDRKAPIVAVNVWYHVGSKNERPGRTGFAHLFEHLMFNGSEHYDDDYFKAVEPIGATDLNGTTNEDRTNYFQNVPTPALDRVLWLESDRMGHLLGAIDQAKLDEQRGVVQNEKRQWENQPYTLSYELITKATAPAGHPYSWTVIGSMEDLDAAKLEDVQEWFKGYYGAANATIVVAGDVKADEVLAKVKKYFGDIPPGPPVARHKAWVAKRAGEQRQQAQDRVPAGRIYKVWNVPEGTSPEIQPLDLAAGVLGSGKNSRLYERLVYREQIATQVASYVETREIGSLFRIEVTAKPGQDHAPIEKAIDEELLRFLTSGPTEAELSRVQTERVADFVRGIERIGGFGGKSDILAASQVYYGDPSAWKEELRRTVAATPDAVKRAAGRWLSDGVYVLEILPYPTLAAAKEGADRSKMPEVGASPAASFPAVERARLGNGLEVVVATRRAVPVVDVRLLLDAGYAADQGGAPGVASLTADMLDEGTKTRSALEISEEAARLGASLSTDADLDTHVVSLSSLKANLDESLALFADVALHPAFPEADFARLRKQLLARIRQEKTQPISMALRVFPRLLYGAGHAYGVPFTGSGYEKDVSKITRDDLARFHRTWFTPTGARIVVVGDTTLAEIRPKLEALFSGWKGGKPPEKKIGSVPKPAKTTVYLVDRPGSIQSVILAGQILPPTANPDEIAFQTMNYSLGGTFTSRINMNLREDKHWSYGSGIFVPDARGPRPLVAYAPVQSDKTKEAMLELAKELREVRGERPITKDELENAKSGQTLTLSGEWETAASVAGSIARILRFGLPDDHYRTLPSRVTALGLADVHGAARKLLAPDTLVWIVVGDRETIEKGIEELGWAEVKHLDADGNPI